MTNNYKDTGGVYRAFYGMESVAQFEEYTRQNNGGEVDE